MSSAVDPIAAVRRHGVVLQSAHGPTPSLAELVAGSPIRGSWWDHPRSHQIFDAINQARRSRTIVATRLLNGKVTLVHRRLWPALVPLADRFDVGALDALDEEHTASRAHRTTVAAFPQWVPADAIAAAEELTDEEALARLPARLGGTLLPASAPERPARRTAGRPW